MGVHEHKKEAPKSVTLGIITVSTTRALINDTSGQWISEQAKKMGHAVVFHQVIPDDIEAITTTLRDVIKNISPQVVLMSSMLTKELTAFGPLFARLSMAEIDSAAIMSRATAGVIGNTVVFCMPGSLNACKLACTRLIFPELGHLVKHVQD
jgi:molybdenum cofactor biosynthesis protein B